MPDTDYQFSEVAEDMHAQAAQEREREDLNDLGDEDDIDPAFDYDQPEPEDRYLDSHWEDMHECAPEFFGGE